MSENLRLLMSTLLNWYNGKKFEHRGDFGAANRISIDLAPATVGEKENPASPTSDASNIMQQQVSAFPSVVSCGN